jgi:hypothetical protein
VKHNWTKHDWKLNFLFCILYLDTSGEENAIRKSVNRELMLTSHFVDDAYDLASSSHKRDEEILKHASQAIVSTVYKSAVNIGQM